MKIIRVPYFIRIHWIRDLISSDEETERIRVKFIRSKDNAADIMTKSLTEALHKLHADRLRNGRLSQCWREDVGEHGDVGEVSPTTDEPNPTNNG